MFRPMIRQNKQLSEEDCRRVLTGEVRGVLSVIGDEGYPYGMPMNHFYDEETGHLFFHGGKIGHKIDALKKCDKASFCVYDSGYRKEGEWALNIRSVIVFGRVRFLENNDEAMALCRKLCAKFTTDSAYIEKEIVSSGPGTLFFELIPEHISGKLVNES